jgi:hypothetical protein
MNDVLGRNYILYLKWDLLEECLEKIFELLIKDDKFIDNLVCEEKRDPRTLVKGDKVLEK